MQTTASKLTAPRYMEHRWGERVDVDCPASLDSYDGALGEGRLRNASISGAFIATAVRLAPLTPLNIKLTAGKGASRRRIELPACVTRSGRDGIAVEWRDMAVPALLTLLREAGASEGLLQTRDRVFG